MTFQYRCLEREDVILDTIQKNQEGASWTPVDNLRGVNLTQSNVEWLIVHIWTVGNLVELKVLFYNVMWYCVETILRMSKLQQKVFVGTKTM